MKIIKPSVEIMDVFDIGISDMKSAEEEISK